MMMPVRVGQSYRTEYVSIVAGPSALMVTGTSGSRYTSSQSAALLSGTQSAGSVE